MPAFYSIYGLTLRSEAPLPGILARCLPDATAADIDLTLADSTIPSHWMALPWRAVRRSAGPGWSVTIATAATARGVVLRIETQSAAAAMTALCGPLGATIEFYSVLPDVWRNFAESELYTWMLEFVLAMAIRQRGTLVLHGNAVDVDGGAVALLGCPGAGKSTLAAALVAAGSSMVADDHVVIGQEGERRWVQPGPPRLRLWPDSLPLLNRLPGELPRVFPDKEKRLVNLDEGDRTAHPRAEAYPLRAIFVLAPRHAGDGDAQCTPLYGAAALNLVLRHRFGTFLIDPQHAKCELEGLARLAETVPIVRVEAADGLDRLPATAGAILGHCAV
jgi:hypothetical protein